MPTNLYGTNDNFHPSNSHVIPGLLRRFHEAKIDNASEVTVWGSGTPKREFLHVDDMAAASIHVMLLNQQVYLHFQNLFPCLYMGPETLRYYLRFVFQILDTY